MSKLTFRCESINDNGERRVTNLREITEEKDIKDRTAISVSEPSGNPEGLTHQFKPGVIYSLNPKEV